MPRTSTGASAPAGSPPVEPFSLIEASGLARSAYRALKVVNHLLAHAEDGTQVGCNDLASLLIPIQERLWSAIDELSPALGEDREA